MDLRTDERLIQQCLEIMKAERKASVSLFQRRLRVGYKTSVALVKVLEERGYLSAGIGSIPCTILRLD